MAIKPTIFKAELDISDMDRGYYQSHTVTLARHASETDERMMVRLVAFALHAHELLSFTDDIASADDPALWQKDLTGAIDLWVEVGQPDEKRLLRACGRARQVVVYSYASSAPIWWSQTEPKVARAKNLTVIHLPAARNLAPLAERSMRFHCLIQDKQIWLTAGDQSLTVELVTFRDRA